MPVAQIDGPQLVAANFAVTITGSGSDIDGHTLTRLALIVFLLLAPLGNDRYSIGHWLLARNDNRSE